MPLSGLAAEQCCSPAFQAPPWLELFVASTQSIAPSAFGLGPLLGGLLDRGHLILGIRRELFNLNLA